MEAIFLEQLSGFLLSEERVDKMLSQLREEALRRQNLVEGLKKNRKELIQKGDALVDLYQKGGLDVEEFKQRHVPLRDRLKEIEAALSRIEKESNTLFAETNAKREALADGVRLRDEWPQMGFDQKRKVVESFVERIVVSGEEVEFDLNYIPGSFVVNSDRKDNIVSAMLRIAIIFTLLAPAAEALPPTFADVPYGDHERQKIDFYQAASDKPTPLVLFIHGGGWTRGDKSEESGFQPYLDAGISVASINYRYSWQAQLDGIHPPVKAPLEDAARALQFIRSKAAGWNIDKTRIGATGTSAGACASLWLAFHDDMADPESPDPVARESTRLTCVAAVRAQTSLDPKELVVWTPNSRYGGHAFGFMDPHHIRSRDTRFAEFLAKRDELLPLIRQYSPIELATADDPPVHLLYTTIPNFGRPEKDPTHTANYGMKLAEKLAALKVPCEFVFPGAPGVKHATAESFLIDTLKR